MTCLALLLSITAGGPRDASSQQGRGARHFPEDDDLRTMLRYLVEDGAAPGIVLGVLEPDSSNRIMFYGNAGPGALPLTRQTSLEIGSITKTFTGALLADMVHRGEVALNDPVAKYLPQSVRVPVRNGREITLLDLATHRSGLPRWPDNHGSSATSRDFAGYSAEKLYEFLSQHTLRRDPGAEAEYSNLGFGLLGHALGRAAGKSYRELLRERILAPLGMRATGFPGEGDELLAKGHDQQGALAPPVAITDPLEAAGALRSNVEDMLTYLKANTSSDTTAVHRALRAAHQVRAQAGNTRIGLAWGIVEHEGRSLLMHSGGTAGFVAQLGLDPQTRAGYVLLANSRAFDDDLGADFLRRGGPLRLKEVNVTRAKLEKYVGEYEVTPGARAVVRMEPEGHLTLRVPRNVRFRMYAESDSAFFLKRTPWRLRFSHDDAGNVTGMTMNMNGRERSATRVPAN